MIARAIGILLVVAFLGGLIFVAIRKDADCKAAGGVSVRGHCIRADAVIELPN